MEEKIMEIKPEEAVKKLKAGNEAYVNSTYNKGNISKEIRLETAEKGQKPYAVVIGCSDSRVPIEHIFSAGIGELFIIRTAGNVIGDFELGSIEYGVGHLGAKVILVLGHNHCGAVEAAVSGHGEGHIQKILDEIVPAIEDGENIEACEKLNIDHSVSRIKESKIIKELLEENKIKLISGKYCLETGEVEFY